MTSCSSDVPENGRLDTGSELTFTASDLSRASVTTGLNYEGSRFAVYGDMKYQNNSKTTVFDNTIVTYSAGKWGYDNIQYWFPLFEYSFVAIHPADAGSATYSNSSLSLTYSLPENFAEASDIVAATHRRIHKENPPSPASPVNLAFFHVLSRVNFRLTNTGAADIVRVNEIKLDGINRTGTLTVTPAPLLSGSQTDDYDFSWSGISNIGNLTAGISVDVPENETRPLFPDDNALFMVPQPDNKGVIMHISYTLIDAGADDEQLTLTAQAPIGGWESGKIYTYSISISEITKEINLSVSVKDWHQPKTADVTVPES